jgi:hypothetical protein
MMRKTIIYILATIILLLFGGCVQKSTEKTTPPHETNQPTATPIITPQPVMITGIIQSIDDNAILVGDVAGLNGEESIVVNVDEDTTWQASKDFFAPLQYITASLSPAMIPSDPPQMRAISIDSLNDVILGKVTAINDGSYTLKPISNFNNFDEIVVHTNENTIWAVDKSTATLNSTVRVALSNMITDSIPPQMGAVALLSIETLD